MFVFIETHLFTRLADRYLSDDELARLQRYLNDNPEAEMRWGCEGRGKRGGLRIIYYLRSRQDEIWLLTLYAKNVAETISGQVLKEIKEEIDGKAQAGHRARDSRRNPGDQAG